MKTYVYLMAGGLGSADFSDTAGTVGGGKGVAREGPETAADERAALTVEVAS